MARREHTKTELFRKLHRKDFNDSEIHIVLEALVEEGLLSETRFLESFIRYRRARGYGPLRIQAELKDRGITEDLIEDHLKITDNAWLIEVRSAWQKRFKNHLPADFKTRAQQMRFLQYRGFTREQIDSIFHQVD